MTGTTAIRLAGGPRVASDQREKEARPQFDDGQEHHARQEQGMSR